MSDQRKMSQAQLEIELIRHTRRLSVIYTVLTAYHQVDELDEVMELLLSQVLEISGSSVGSIHLLDETGDTLDLVAHQGMSDITLQEMRRISAEDNLISEFLTRSNPMIITDMSTEPSTAKIAQISGWDVCICIPIIDGKTTRGVLSIYGDKTLQATAEEIELLKIIARQIGIAIENSYLREQAELLAITEERNRLARELHDSVTQSLYSLTLFAETAKRMMEMGDQAETRRCLDEIADSSQQALKEMRLLVYKLRPSTYSEGGLSATIEQRLRAVEGRSGVKYHFKVDERLSLRTEVENALYSITVEALNNALKYARADQVWVELTRDGEAIYLEITDNGCGFDPEQAMRSGGLGLVGILERVAELCGKFEIDSGSGKGTTIRIWLPDKDKTSSQLS